MDDPAVRGAARRLVHLPGVGRGSDEHFTRRRAGLAHRFPVAAHRRGSARRLDAEDRVLVGVVRGSLLEADLRPVRLEVLGDELRDRGEYALAHLGQTDDHRDRVVGRNPEERVGLKRHGRRIGRPRRPGQRDTEYQSASDDGAGLQEIAPGFVGDRRRHLTLPSSASRPRHGSPRGSACTFRSGRDCRTSRRRCRRRSGFDSSPAARRRP